MQAIERLNLDGLLALWHPPKRIERGRPRFRRVMIANVAGGPGRRAMIKSELVQRIAEQNPHLYQRDVENIVNADPRRDHRGDGARRPRRVARLRRVLGQAPPGAHRPQSAHRRDVAVDQKSVPFFKTGKEMRERLNKA